MSDCPSINWITEGTNLFDYRPAIGPDGETVIFERTFAEKPHFTQLYTTNINGGDITPFISGFHKQQTRADWYWPGNRVVFNNDEVWLVNGDGSDPKAIPGTEKFGYPQWNNDGQSLTVMNGNTATADPQPCSSVIDLAGTMLLANINGTDAAHQILYGGMPAASPVVANLVAYAGQPDIKNWVFGKPGYQQDYNYIFINSMDENNTFTSAPMESGASTLSYDSVFQGRAPAWSPDGNYIVFESTRINDVFALFLFNRKTQKVTQLTDTSIQAQHGKFFPGGTKIIFCGKPTKELRNRIGWIDVSAYL